MVIPNNAVMYIALCFVEHLVWLGNTVRKSSVISWQPAQLIVKFLIAEITSSCYYYCYY